MSADNYFISRFNTEPDMFNAEKLLWPTHTAILNNSNNNSPNTKSVSNKSIALTVTITVTFKNQSINK